MPRPARVPGAALAVLIVVAAGCGGASDTTPTRPETIDPGAGTFRGVSLGESVAKAEKELGTPCKRGPNQFGPCRLDNTDLSAPSGFPGQWGHLGFDGVTLLVRGERVKAFVIADRNAHTDKGVGVGDPLDLAKERYPGVRCLAIQFEEGTGRPYCEMAVSGHWIVFGNDPIDTIALGGPGIA